MSEAERPMTDSRLDRFTDIADQRLVALYDYWADKLASADMRRSWPLRGDIDPTEIPNLLPYLMLVGIEGPDRFRFRLVGTNVAYGVDPTGKILGESAPEGPYRAHILSLFGETPRRGAPVYTLCDYANRTGERTTHRVFLPLGDRAAPIELMLVGQITEADGQVHASLWQEPPEEIAVRILRELPVPPSTEPS